MVEDVKKCVDARVNFFEEYFTVPLEMQGEVDGFTRKVTALGEECENAAEFEEKFASTGLSDSFNAILPKCKPKPVKMTKEQKKQSRTIMKEMIVENKDELIKDALSSAGKRVLNDIKDEKIAENRERMIEDGTFDDYTRARNNAEDGGRIARFFKDKFNKK